MKEKRTQKSRAKQGKNPRPARQFLFGLQQLCCDHSGKKLRRIGQGLPAGGFRFAKQHRAHRVGVRLDGNKNIRLQGGTIQQRYGSCR